MILRYFEQECLIILIWKLSAAAYGYLSEKFNI